MNIVARVNAGRLTALFDAALPRAITMLLLLWASWLAGSWLAAWLAPSAPSYRVLSRAAPAENAARVAGSWWFGEPAPETAAAAPAGQLIGLMQGGDKGGFAVVDEGGHVQVLLLGQQTLSGWKLDKIDADAVELSSGGQTQRLPLRPRGGGHGGAFAGVPGGGGGMPSPGGMVVPGMPPPEGMSAPGMSPQDRPPPMDGNAPRD